MTPRITTTAEFAALTVAPPTPTGESRPFWSAIANGELLIQRCAECGTAQGYPRSRCVECWSRSLDWARATGRGRLVTHTVVHRPGQQSWADIAPYAVGLVRLDEGAVLLTHLLTEGQVPRVGDHCELEVTMVGEWALPLFRVTAAGSGEQS